MIPDTWRSTREGRRAAICTSVCTPLDEGTLEAAIARLTVALTTATDEDIPGLVAERRALREELHAMRRGRGTRVGGILPAVSGRVAVGPDGTGEPQPQGRRGRVLLIDDEPLIVKVLADMLAPEYDVTCETSSESALARLRDGERFDAIVCDLMMPQLTGMDLHEALVQLAPDQARAMLFLTGGAFTPRARAFLDRVMGAALEKPVHLPALVERLRRLVG